MDMTDQALVMVMTKGIGANLTNDEKRAHLIDLKRERLIDQVCTQEILPPRSNHPIRRDIFVSMIKGFHLRRHKLGLNFYDILKILGLAKFLHEGKSSSNALRRLIQKYSI